MQVIPSDRELLKRLVTIPEISASGFSAREGLTGSGVTILKGNSYFGSWRVTAGKLVFVASSMGEPNQFVDGIDEAVRHTLLLILRSLQAKQLRKPLRAIA